MAETVCALRDCLAWMSGTARIRCWSVPGDAWPRSTRATRGITTSTPRGVLPLAPGRGAHRGRRLTHRGDRAAPRGPRSPDSDRSQAALRELQLLAQRARLDLAPPPAAFSRADQGPEEILDLTPRETERSSTSSAAATPIARSPQRWSAASRPVSVHVSHILRKLGAPNRLEAAASEMAAGMPRWPVVVHRHTCQGFSSPPRIGGSFERMFAPRVMRAIYMDELNRLDAYAREHRSP